MECDIITVHMSPNHKIDNYLCACRHGLADHCILRYTSPCNLCNCDDYIDEDVNINVEVNGLWDERNKT